MYIVSEPGQLTKYFHFYGYLPISTGSFRYSWKLKAKKYYNKIIFKCVNNIVKSIFNEKVTEKWNLWVYKQYTVCIDWLKKIRKVKFYDYCSCTCINRSSKSHKHVKKIKRKITQKNANAVVPKLSLSVIWWVTRSFESWQLRNICNILLSSNPWQF